MFRSLFFISWIFIFSTGLFSQNSCPIILIHGFLGWGRDEMAGYYYWGGRTDLETELKSAGFEVYTVSVGPISSSWDRAIETFYQIKGGQVDYGNDKTEEYGIIQKPKNKKYKGFYPKWDAKHPVHIISHSQGGQTARMLEVLLKQSVGGEGSLLLSNKLLGWIKSLTTISTPHNGSTLVPIMLDVFPFALSLAPWFGSIDNKIINKLYSFDLEHWGLERGVDESFDVFFSRLKNSPVSESKNLCSWELSPAGAKEFNQLYEEDPNVYYFSFSTYSTKVKNSSTFHKPDSGMSVHLWPTGILMGKYNNAIDSTWYENDGIVNTVSMSHPFDAEMIPFNGNPVTGIWQSVNSLKMDHQAIIGHGVFKKQYKNIIALYNNHCNLLYSL